MRCGINQDIASIVYFMNTEPKKNLLFIHANDFNSVRMSVVLSKKKPALCLHDDTL